MPDAQLLCCADEHLDTECFSTGGYFHRVPYASRNDGDIEYINRSLVHKLDCMAESTCVFTDWEVNSLSHPSFALDTPAWALRQHEAVILESVNHFDGFLRFVGATEVERLEFDPIPVRVADALEKDCCTFNISSRIEAEEIKTVRLRDTLNPFNILFCSFLIRTTEDRIADANFLTAYSTSVKIALFFCGGPWHTLSSHLAKSAVSGHAQYTYSR